MYKLGFTQLDALDACQQMLDQAKEKSIYGRLICDFMGPNRMDIQDGKHIH